jgi:hypothetical protein
MTGLLRDPPPRARLAHRQSVPRPAAAGTAQPRAARMTPMLLIRPGGWIIVHEPLRFPPPRSHPPLDALGTYWEMLHGVLERAGVPAGTVEDLPAAARAVGLDVASADGFFVLGEPELAFEIHAGTLTAFAGAAVQLGIAAKTIDGLIGSLRAGKAGGYEWVSTPFFIDLALRRP